ncbi:fucolectin-like isoform X2 [Dendrobates tinctorius]|uniref:fucolectin-like isoform X2 n=1 Tax=Dendrobates tinctorius TaxID=92724 RepID=UPI003CC9B668
MFFLTFIILWISVSGDSDHCFLKSRPKTYEAQKMSSESSRWQLDIVRTPPISSSCLSFLDLYRISRKGVQNVALRGRPTQSTNFESLSAAINAIDGNVDPLYQHGSCFSSKSEPSPWWRVDLLETYTISHITITTRGDCCPDLINGAEILIGDSLANNGNNNPRCVKITTIPQAGSQTFQCDGMTGRYVNIIRPDITGYLSFCEVEVYGSPVNCRCYK